MQGERQRRAAAAAGAGDKATAHKIFYSEKVGGGAPGDDMVVLRGTVTRRGQTSATTVSWRRPAVGGEAGVWGRRRSSP